VSIALPLFTRGRHKPGVVNARLRRQVRDLEADNQQLTQRADAADVYAHKARLRACKDAMRIAQLEAERDELKAAVARMDEQQGKTIRGFERQAAELTRRLELRSQTEAVVTKTQPIPVFFAGTKLASADAGRATTH
jgi:hypothetical protein